MNREAEMQGVVEDTKTLSILEGAVAATRSMSAETLGRTLVFVLAYVKSKDEALFTEITDVIAGTEADRG